VAAAAGEFGRVGYDGTDSNRLARAAGYAPGTFYKHFPDKRAIFLEAYRAWVTAEWTAIDRLLRGGGAPREQATRIVDLALAHHRRWRGLRASLRALVVRDPVVRAFYRRQRRRQLDLLAALRQARGRESRPRADDAVLLYTLERVCDALADGELSDLGLDAKSTIARLVEIVARHIGVRRAPIRGPSQVMRAKRVSPAAASTSGARSAPRSSRTSRARRRPAASTPSR
jgi:AcrR family transcriptional regulator